MSSIKRETKKRVMKKNVETKVITEEKPMLNLGDKLHNFMRTEQVIGSKAMHDIMKLLCLRFIQPLIKPNGKLAKLVDKESYIKDGEYLFKDIELANLDVDKLLLLDSSGFKPALYKIWDILHMNPLTERIFKESSFFTVSTDCLRKCLNEICTTLRNINFDNSDYDIKGLLYEHFINGYADKGGKEFGQFFTPRSMIKLIRKLSNKYFSDEVKSIYDPCMGTAGFLTEMYKEHKSTVSDDNVSGGELEPDTYAIALMNMILTTGSKCNVKCINSLTNNENVKYDLIGTNPPFGMKGIKYDDVIKGCEFKDGIDPKKLYPIKTNDGSALFLQHCIGKLSDNGVCNIVLPDGQLLSGKTFIKLRKHLLTTCNLTAVLCAPSGAFTNAGVKTAVLIFNRKVVDDKLIPTDKVDFYSCDKECKEYTLTGTVCMEQFEKSNYSLDYNMYVVREEKTFSKEKCEMKTLGEVCEFLPTGKRNSKEGNDSGTYPLYYCSILGNLYMETFDFEYNEIIMNKTNGSGKCEIYLALGKHSVAQSTIRFISSDNTRINIIYVYYYLRTIKNSIEELYSGTLQKQLNVELFNKIQIPIYSLETQQQIILDCELYEKKKNNLKEYISILKQEAECLHRLMIKPLFKNEAEVKTLGEVCNIVIGFTPSTSNEEFYGGNNIWVSIADMTKSDLLINQSSRCLTDLAVANKINKLNKKGTVLLSFKLSIGKVAIAGCDLYTNEAIAGINGKDSNLISNMYIAYYLKTSDISEGSFGMIGGGSLNKDSLSKIQIPIPSLEIQQQIISQYNKIYNAIDESEKIILQYEDNIKFVFKSTF